MYVNTVPSIFRIIILPQSITALITGSFDKCDSDGANCEDLDDQSYEEPSSASTMTTMTVAIIALIKLF